VIKVSSRSNFLVLLKTLKTKLAKSSHTPTELVLSVIVNHEEYLLRAIADTGGISSIIPEVYTSDPFIKTYDSNTNLE
jgi:hypothetical protein